MDTLSTGFCPIVSRITSNAFTLPAIAALTNDEAIPSCTLFFLPPPTSLSSARMYSSSSRSVRFRLLASPEAIPARLARYRCSFPCLNGRPIGSSAPVIGLFRFDTLSDLSLHYPLWFVLLPRFLPISRNFAVYFSAKYFSTLLQNVYKRRLKHVLHSFMDLSDLADFRPRFV